MQYPYRIFTDATADLSPALREGLPPVSIIPMELIVDGASYVYGAPGGLEPAAFYRMLREGRFAQTSQINPELYRAAFEDALMAGQDILYLCFSSGLSNTCESASAAIADVSERWPQRRIEMVDTLCASVGEGLLVREALLRQAQGASLEELAAWARESRLAPGHWFTVDTFEHLRRGGRVSAVAATVGSILQIKPTLSLDAEGRLVVVAKPRGQKQALRLLIERMEEQWRPELSRDVVVAHADCPDSAQQLTELVAERFPEARILPAEIGPVIGAHVGPGMLALAYWSAGR